LDVRLERGTIWLTQAQMVVLLGRDQSVIARHLANVFAEGELPASESNMQRMHIADPTSQSCSIALMSSFRSGIASGWAIRA